MKDVAQHQIWEQSRADGLLFYFYVQEPIRADEVVCTRHSKYSEAISDEKPSNNEDSRTLAVRFFQNQCVLVRRGY